jgi:hypothetical protein
LCSVLVVSLWIARSRHPRMQRVRLLLLEGTLLHAAVLVAGINGLKGRWKVWNG